MPVLMAAVWSETPGPFGAISEMMADEVCLPINRQRCLLLNHPGGENDRGEETFQEVDATRVEEIIAASCTRWRASSFAIPKIALSFKQSSVTDYRPPKD
jgi:hypothetical protein